MSLSDLEKLLVPLDQKGLKAVQIECCFQSDAPFTALYTSFNNPMFC